MNRLSVQVIEEEEISEPRVMKSAAGHYIGYEYWDTVLGAWLPWSRQTEYINPVEALICLVDFVISQAESDMEAKVILDYYRPGLTNFVITAISRGYCDE